MLHYQRLLELQSELEIINEFLITIESSGDSLSIIHPQDIVQYIINRIHFYTRDTDGGF